MWYHAKLEYEGPIHYWWNLSRGKLTEDLLVPFVNGQVILINRRGRNTILNLKNVTHLTVYRTSGKLDRPIEGRIPTELKSENFEHYDCTAEIIQELRAQQAPAASRSVLQKTLTPTKRQVFVVMKFGDARLDSAYEGVIKPVAGEFGLTALRIDEVQNSGRISDQVLDQIAVSQYILADLTGARPNCYYEAGFAHALGKELILTIGSGEPVHFDLAGYRFIVWHTEAELRKFLRERFKSLEAGGQS